MTAIWGMFIYIVAVCVSLLENIISLVVGEIETIVGQAVPGTAAWIQYMVTIFEYNASSPDIVIVNPDFTVGYANPNVNDQIVSQCAVQVNGGGLVLVKVATGSPPAPLDGAPGTSGPQCQSLIGYLNTILPAGMSFQLSNLLADILQVNAIIYYNGQYTAVIQQNVIAALTEYMATLPFNGYVKASAIEEAILAVPGVIDVTISQVTCTPNGGSPTNLILAGALLTREYQTYAGYIVNDPSNLFSNTLSFQVTTN